MKYNADAHFVNVAAIVVCAGKGERSGLPYNKVLHQIGHKTVLERVLDTLTQTEIGHITVVTSPTDLQAMQSIAAEYNDVSVVIGGATRTESVFAGLKAHACDIVVIHDGARPFVSPQTVTRAIESAIAYGSGIVAVPSVDTVKRVDSDGVAHSLPRAELYNAQTPQVFRYSEILSAYQNARGVFTDDAEVYESAGYSPRLVSGEYGNIKVTTPNDFIGLLPKNCRIGVGFDLHRLVENRKLILGGVSIDHEKGLLGHSDADVLTHAIMDALLSAANLPDIGVLFPDTDNKYLGISSITLLKEVVSRVKKQGYDIGNISAVVIAQRPKLAPIIADIRQSLAKAIGINVDQINVSATTTERMGLIGNGDAIAANASCILAENSNGQSN